MIKVIEEITKIVEWYGNLPKDFTNITDLMYSRQKLSAYQFALSVELGTLRQEWKQCEAQTEFVRRNKAVEGVNEGLPMSKVVELSKASALECLKLEKTADGMYNRIKFIIESTESVNQSITQHISILKIEQKNAVTQV